MVLAHVDELGCLAYALECGLGNSLGRAGKGDYGAVGGLAGVDVEQ